MNERNKNFDLEERTAKFGEEIVKFCKRNKKDSIIDPIVNQLIHSGTSVGANYCEANNASSKKDLTKYIFARKNQKKQNIGSG